MSNSEYILKHDDTDVILFEVNTDYYTVNIIWKFWIHNLTRLTKR